MKVNLAAQVLSDTVANALEELYGDQVVETVRFIRHMNKFFDSMNTRNINEEVCKRQSNLKEYSQLNDCRFQYLLQDFLWYFSDWEERVGNRAENFTKSQRHCMMLSTQTVKGIKISVNSIVESTKFLLAEGAKFVLTNQFNQDPLEEHFAHYRYKGGSNDNHQYLKLKIPLLNLEW